jgi:hypothetical protein
MKSFGVICKAIKRDHSLLFLRKRLWAVQQIEKYQHYSPARAKATIIANRIQPLFACGTPHRLLRRVSLAKPTSAPSRSDGFAERRLNLSLVSTQSREKHTAGAGCSSAHHQRPSDLSTALPPPLLPQELRRHDPQSTKLQPLVPENMASAASPRLLDSPVFRPRSSLA